ncbi:MAG: Wzz/FepE/Etk N-terminal domain-containing protein [Thiohalomonadaceae bacterium]
MQQSDEIDLAALWQTIKRRKWTALGTMGVILALAVAYLVVTKPVYESEAAIYLGEFNEVLLEQPAPLVTRFNARLGKEAKARTDAITWIEKIAPDRSDKRLIKLTVRAPSPSEAQSLARAITDEITSEHKERFDQLARGVREELAQLEQLMKTGRGALEEASSARVADSVQRLNLWAAMMYSSGELANIQSRIGELRDMLEGSKTSLTRVLEQPTLAKKPASPKVPLILALALVGGAVLGLMVVFLSEAVRSRSTA